jgi:hypothetical protein
MICDECETVAHCLKNGCVPKQPSKDEALKLALEALERYQVKRQDFDRFADEITAIKQALAAPVQEPVAWVPILTWRWNNEQGYWEGRTITPPAGEKK